jgi:hypothetical protein
MGKVRRIDKIIGILLLVALLALVGMGLARHTAEADAPTLTGTSSRPHGSSTGTPSQPSTTVAASTAAVSGTVGTTPTTVAPTSPTSPTTPTTGAGPPAVPGPVTAVGDSIMIDMQPYLQTDIPGVSVDGVVSRQFETGIGVVQADRAAGTLGSVLVVELGTNGTVTSSDFDAMMQAADGVKRVVFVNVNVPRPWETADNNVLAAGVARYPGLAVLADWNALSTPHPEWFTADQVHLEPEGAQAMAALVAQNA